MFENFLSIAAVSPKINVANCRGNAASILTEIKNTENNGISVLCFPELCITGYTCGDLFLQDVLLDNAENALDFIINHTKGVKILTAIGLPICWGNKLFSAAAVIFNGNLLAVIPKTYIPNYGEFYELRHFSPAPDKNSEIKLKNGKKVPFGKNIIFTNGAAKISVEICEDLWGVSPPSVNHASASANIILNLSASDETIGKRDYRRDLVRIQSARLLCAYVYAGAGKGESTTDLVFGGHTIICENGVVLSESNPFEEGYAHSEIDLSSLERDRRYMNDFPTASIGEYLEIPFEVEFLPNKQLTRFIDPFPFVPHSLVENYARCEEILTLQSAGLAKRLLHTGMTAVIGVSGGLDSCLALLVAARTFKSINWDCSKITAVIMPCFGTTQRTKNNAYSLCNALGVTIREIDISEEVKLHLKSINEPENSRTVVYENAQARVRTLVLMNIANQLNALVVGTGDLSELALGFATYNGDHMSMYAVNSGVPKTLVRHIVSYVAETDTALSVPLKSILATPVSPELLPPEEGEISQKTEDIVGPYELHDFFLYHTIRRGRSPDIIYELAKVAFPNYDSKTILRWLKIFVKRFFAQQFKRSCLPDGPKIGSVTLSPRGDWRAPSDASSLEWACKLDLLD
ncbi:MAG: NAD(+) synthase [Clostridiales bacterium]|nr:NAD(+) synthase [Clostridiales bacterium]